MVDMSQPAATEQNRRDEVAALQWYHTIELAPGIETPGWHDTRPIVGQIPFPASLAGQRCLDVGTFDGFWAFEMERRGASEVVAIDILNPPEWDWPAGSEDAVLAEIGSARPPGAASRSPIARSARPCSAWSAASTTSTSRSSGAST